MGLERRNSDFDLDEYFVGPRDVNRHSKWPMFLRIHGSVLPQMILPLFFIGGWATLFTCLDKLEVTRPLGISSLLLTVLGFVVGLALSFRSSTAYERYAEGRKYWAQLMLTSQQLARLIWVLIREREGEEGKQDLLAKISALNLINAFAVALKHRLRFEPYTHYSDLQNLVEHLDTFAKEASTPELTQRQRPSKIKSWGKFLGLSFAVSNPRKTLKTCTKPVGNLPLEILSYLSAYLDSTIDNKTLLAPIHQTHAMNNVAALNDVLTGTDRILNTPLPIAYSIAIAQITWVYVLLLPFQLLSALDWITIPATMFAAYIILAIAHIGQEIENPFGDDVNDLPLDAFCKQLAAEIDVIAATPAPKQEEFVRNTQNLVLFPLSVSGYELWESRSVEQIRKALRDKVNMTMNEKADVTAAAVTTTEKHGDV
ncbi:UPF0187-domain-containing protein [Aulographum hederae CBS 113979]|uniref:UPF0187-domain-containing protein n=1 Tax=Aulographum hederae CBS 113979 TaxID=1176131 RepID=A0A6G1HGN0_9PEZI|nr:UPF0187-domain-containing protein [Aulographum hederae CBS 113979]